MSVISAVKIIRLVKGGHGNEFCTAQSGPQSRSGKHQRAIICCTGRIFVVNIDTVQTILLHSIGTLNGKGIGLGVGSKTAPAGILMIAQYIEQYIYAQRLQVGYFTRIKHILHLWIKA
ncbi:hypothetical protein D3C73_1238770 [compost metagenome]